MKCQGVGVYILDNMAREGPTEKGTLNKMLKEMRI